MNMEMQERDTAKNVRRIIKSTLYQPSISVVGFLLPKIGENVVLIVTYQFHIRPRSTLRTGQNKRKESGDE